MRGAGEILPTPVTPQAGARGRFDITLNCVPNILSVTIWSASNSLLYIVSEMICGAKANRHKIDPAPIFVLGHWRSGTTFLHDLLACDPAHGYPTTYQCFFPNHFLLTGGAVRRWFNVVLPKRRPMDSVPVGVDRPQEDEFAFANLGMGTHYVTFAWPRHGSQDVDYLDLVNLSDEERSRPIWRGKARISQMSSICGKTCPQKSSNAGQAISRVSAMKARFHKA